MFQDNNRDDDGADGAIDEAAHQILQAAIDPIEWKTELERVGPKLRAQQQLPTHEWRAHVDQVSIYYIRIHCDGIDILNLDITIMHILSQEFVCVDLIKQRADRQDNERCSRRFINNEQVTALPLESFN